MHDQGKITDDLLALDLEVFFELGRPGGHHAQGKKNVGPRASRRFSKQANREICVSRQFFRRLVAGTDLDVDLGMQCRELAQPGYKKLAREKRLRGDAD